MTDGKETVPSASRVTWLKRALVASLAVNLLVAGLSIGHRGWHGGRHHGPRGSSGAEFGIMSYVRSLGEERRKIISQAARSERPDFRALREEVRQARRQAADILASEPFDKEKVRAALSGVGEADGRLKNAGVAALLAAAEKMTPEERAGLVAWWKSRRPYHFRETSREDRKDRSGPDAD